MRVGILPALAFWICMPFAFSAFSSSDTFEGFDIEANMAEQGMAFDGDEMMNASGDELNLEEGASDEFGRRCCGRGHRRGHRRGWFGGHGFGGHGFGGGFWGGFWPWYGYGYGYPYGWYW